MVFLQLIALLLLWLRANWKWQSFAVGFSMKLKMKNIMVISKLMDPEVVDNTRDLALWLIKHDKLNV